MSNSQIWTALDGTQLVIHEMGKGRPLLLLHGYVSDAQTNWIKYGTAERLVAAGYRCIMPDLRAHGASDKPHDAACYSPDILADDALGLVAHLGLNDYDLAGYSLGGRTVARMLVRGATPGRAIIAGMGLEGLTQTAKRRDHFRYIMRNIGKHERGSPEWMAEAFLKTTGGDPVALDLLLDSFVDTSEDKLAALDVPIGILCGDQDQDNGSAEALADILVQGKLITIPGNHMSAVVKPEFGAAMADFLTA